MLSEHHISRHFQTAKYISDNQSSRGSLLTYSSPMVTRIHGSLNVEAGRVTRVQAIMERIRVRPSMYILERRTSEASAKEVAFSTSSQIVYKNKFAFWRAIQSKHHRASPDHRRPQELLVPFLWLSSLGRGVQDAKPLPVHPRFTEVGLD
jgi:hypothetical protein